MKYFYYKTRIGTFYIRQSKDNPKIFHLWIGEELLGSYSSPINAADDVYMQATGYHEWDSLESADNPHDISEWEVIIS
jgi:hypothetical protein